jgi:Mycothiol maleylpyruvate isomerase N-terminal domain
MSPQGTRSSWRGDNRYDAALQAETARFAEAVHDADPARPVPTCPEWTLAYRGLRITKTTGSLTAIRPDATVMRKPR